MNDQVFERQQVASYISDKVFDQYEVKSLRDIVFGNKASLKPTDKNIVENLFKTRFFVIGV